MKQFLLAILFFITVTNGYAQIITTEKSATSGAGKMQLIKTTLFYKDSRIDPVTHEKTYYQNTGTKFQFLIDGKEMGAIGWRAENLKPYFKDCAGAMKHFNRMLKRHTIGSVSKITGAVLFLPGFLITALGEDANSKTMGIGLLAGAGTLLIVGLIEEKQSDKSLYSAVDAYNACETKSTSLLKKISPSDISLVSLKTNTLTNITGVQLRWNIGN